MKNTIIEVWYINTCNKLKRMQIPSPCSRITVCDQKKYDDDLQKALNEGTDLMELTQTPILLKTFEMFHKNKVYIVAAHDKDGANAVLNRLS